MLRRRMDRRACSRLGLVGLGLLALSVAPSARAAEPAGAVGAERGAGAAVRESAPPESGAQQAWRRRYDAAREEMLAGRFREAQVQFLALSAEAPTTLDRDLAREMARVAGGWADRDAAKSVTSSPSIRTRSELTLLYATSFLYGVGTGVWFLLQTQPESALTATLPFAALVAAPIVAVASVDALVRFPRGVPHAISAGTYLGLGQGAWISGYAAARARRIERSDPATSLAWKPEVVSSVLWTSATLGGVLGGALGSTLETTPGRVSFVASTSIWSGALFGLGASALSERGPAGREAAFVTGGAGYNAGLVGGMLAAGAVSPSVARVRLVDLSGVAGGLVTSGFYLAFTRDVQPRAFAGLAALGATAGLATGWILTSGMNPEPPGGARPAAVTVQPVVSPLNGGATLGVAGAL